MMDAYDYLGCGDGGCVVERPTGMHTNGGCKCLMDLPMDTRRRVRAAFKRLRDKLATAKAQPAVVVREEIPSAEFLERRRKLNRRLDALRGGDDD